MEKPDFSLSKFHGKVALITGASSGIGAGAAIHLARLGASLALTGRNEDNLAKTGAECEQVSQTKPLLIVGDVTIEDDVTRIVSDTVKHFGRLDILVNNAGILAFGSIETTTLNQYDRIFSTNVRSVYHMTMLCTPHLVATKGNIINVSSIAGLRAFQGVVAYCMSKASLDQMTRCVALDLAPKGVRCNAVNPAAVKTEVLKRSGLTDQQVAAEYEHSKETHPLGRPGEVEDVARTIAFLASDEASFVTGACLPVDGGCHALNV